MRYTHTCKLTFVVDSDDPHKPTPAEIINTVTDLLYQVPEYITNVDIVDTCLAEEEANG